MKRARLLLAAAFLASLLGACAVTDEQDNLGPSVYAPPPHTEDPARIALPPVYRPFFDALEDEGDWTLVEPYGYCFRPRVNFVAWRPYQDGWWEPSDSFGWIWNTDEPFGWVTYHYGAWFYDEYQGWLWQPGPNWGPAWVAWVETGDYIGWAPLAPVSYDRFDRIPDGVFTYAQTQQFSARNVAQQALYVSRLPQATSNYHAIVNLGRANGVTFNKGPDAVQLRSRGGLVGTTIDADILPRVPLKPGVAKPNEADVLERTNRLVDEGARELRRMREGQLPPTAPRLLPPPTAMPRAPKPKPVARDTTVRRDSTHAAAPHDSTLHRPTPRRTPPRQRADQVPDTTSAR